MYLNNRKSNYDKNPYIKINSHETNAWKGYESLVKEIKNQIDSKPNDKIILIFDYYHGVLEDEIFDNFISKFEDAEFIYSEKAKMKENQIFRIFEEKKYKCYNIFRYFKKRHPWSGKII